MSKIISFIITFLNRINKIIWKIIIFLSKFIKIDDVEHPNDKPTDERYRLFKVDQQPIIEPFAKLEHKDFKQLITNNNIKPIKRRNGKQITINVLCPCCGLLKIISMIIMVNKINSNVKFVHTFSLLILTKIKMLFLNVLIVLIF